MLWGINWLKFGDPFAKDSMTEDRLGIKIDNTGEPIHETMTVPSYKKHIFTDEFLKKGSKSNRIKTKKHTGYHAVEVQN